MNKKTNSVVRFLVAAVFYHAVTYFVAGFLASSLLDYEGLFRMPVIRDYYRPFGSSAVFAGPLLQILRGLIFGAVLIPFRAYLAGAKLGWLHLWLLFIGIGILGTPAAAPASVEGMIYSKLPLWFHLLGLPEMLLQTLAFSLLVHRYLRPGAAVLHPYARKALGALSAACLSFIGYTVVSLAFAFAVGAGIDGRGTDLRLLGQFLAPLAVTFLVHLAFFRRRPAAVHGLLYAASALSLGAYQHFILGSANLIYVFAAPILPVLISYRLIVRNAEAAHERT